MRTLLCFHNPEYYVHPGVFEIIPDLEIDNCLEEKIVCKYPLENSLSSVCHWSLPHHTFGILRLHIELNKTPLHILKGYRQERARLVPQDFLHFWTESVSFSYFLASSLGSCQKMGSIPVNFQCSEFLY